MWKKGITNLSLPHIIIVPENNLSNITVTELRSFNNKLHKCHITVKQPFALAMFFAATRKKQNFSLCEQTRFTMRNLNFGQRQVCALTLIITKQL